jgi:hypothetical protein
MKGLHVNDELERIWKEAVVDYFNALSRQDDVVLGFDTVYTRR